MKTLENLVRRDPRVASYTDERQYGNGYLVYLADGYCWGADPGCATRGFDTVRDVLDDLYMIQPDPSEQ